MSGRLRREGLAMFGHLGDGWVLRLAGVQLRDIEPYAGVQGRTSREIVELTRAVWP